MPGAGSLLTAFESFAFATTNVKVSGPETIINDAQARTFLLGWMTRGDRGMKRMLHNGKRIQENMILEDARTFKYHRIGATQEWTNPQQLRQVEVDWRYAIDHMTWARQEIILNERIRYGNKEQVFCAFVDILRLKEMVMYTSTWNGMDGSLFTKPTLATMGDSPTSNEPTVNSLFYWINEDTNGLFNPRSSAVFTTVGGIDPTAVGYESFVPVQQTYSTEAINTIGNILSAFDRTWKLIRFEKPPSMQEYFTDPRYNNQLIITSSAGHTVYSQLIRQHTAEGFHNIAGSQDPAIPDPQYFGIPVVWQVGMDNADVYQDVAGTDTTTEGLARLIGPRFIWLNTNFLYPCFHDEVYMSKDKPRQSYNNVDEYVMPVSTWWQTLCTSRQRQAIVSPSADLFTEFYNV